VIFGAKKMGLMGFGGDNGEKRLIGIMGRTHTHTILHYIIYLCALRVREKVVFKSKV
jgi:hypothetical protein